MGGDHRDADPESQLDDVADQDPDQAERHPLLQQPAAGTRARASDPAGRAAAPPTKPRRVTAACGSPKAATALATAASGSPDGPLGVCRICLEDDALTALEAPCACTGTQRHAHHACIQKWVNEKHTLRCEICDTDYKGAYTVPPLPAPLLPDAPLPLVTPLGSLYLTIASDRDGAGAGRRGTLLVDSSWADEDEEEAAPPAVSWCASLLVFLLFMLVLHHSVVINVPGDSVVVPGAIGSGGLPTGPGDAVMLPAGGTSPGASASAFAGGGPLDATTPSAADLGGGGGGGAAAAAQQGALAAAPGTALAAGVSLFLLWVLTKVLLVAVPLATLMRIAARQHAGGDGDEDEELGARGSGASASASRAELAQQRLQQQMVMLARLRRYLQIAEAQGADNRGSSGRPRVPGL